MSIQRLSFCVGATFLVAACASAPLSVPLDAKWVRCDTSRPGARCEIRVVEDATGPHTCALGSFRVVPAELELTGRRPVFLQWEAPRGYAFCDRDSVTLKSGFDEARGDVYESFGVDDAIGSRKHLDTEAQCRPFRAWRWANANPGSTHAYQIRFSDPKSGRTCTIDPWIRNG